jgi:hypothetical protein
MFGAVILSFGLLALAVLKLLCAPLIRCLASPRLFSLCCCVVMKFGACKGHSVDDQLIRSPKLDRGNATTFTTAL